MTRLDLITGFLGAGKTTFLRRYGSYLLDRGEKLAVLVYDHGAVNVDLPLLRELSRRGAELEMLAAACDDDCRRRRFRTKLISLGLQGFDRVIVEPSGVFDMDEFFDALAEPPLESWYEPGSVIAVVDAGLGPGEDPEENFYLASQTACAGCVLLSRTQLASEAQLASTLRRIEEAEKALRCYEELAPRLLSKPWDQLTERDFERLASCGCRRADYVKTLRQDGYQSLSFLELSLPRTQLEDKVERLFSDRRYGEIRRVKGFFRDGEQSFQINATPGDRQIEPVPAMRGAILVVGSGLNEEAISLLMTGRPPEHKIL